MVMSRWFARAVLAIILVAASVLATHAVLLPDLAYADDGDGGDGGSGGGGGGSGAGGDGASDSWRPFGRPATRVRCSCPGWFLLGCTCRQGAARRPQASVRVVTRPSELLVTGFNDEDLERLARRGFRVLGRRQSALLGTAVVRLRAPALGSLRAALRSAGAAAPAAIFVENDVYPRLSWSTYTPQGGGCGDRCEAFQLTAWTRSIGTCSAETRIGVIDTHADLSHPSLRDAPVTLHSVRSTDRPVSDAEHGTAVLSLLAGTGQSEIVGLAQGAPIFMVDAFHKTRDGAAADAFDLIAGLDWLVEQRVKVINLSLSGTDNALLKLAISEVIEKDIAIVAAAGRADRSDTQGFPGRYPGVVAVSSVDNRLRPARSTTKGVHVAFAAPGVGLTVAGPRNGVQRVDGTSFAAPFVTAAFAIGLGRAVSPARLTESLAESARDLGAPGRDAVYGWGLVQYAGLPPC